MFPSRLFIYERMARLRGKGIPSRPGLLLSLAILAFPLGLQATPAFGQESATAATVNPPANNPLDDESSSVTSGLPQPGPSVPFKTFESDSVGNPDAVPERAMDGGQIKVVDQKSKPTEHVEQEVLIEGLYSYGNYKIFASGYDDKLYTAGVEYNRHSWGNFLKGQMDYVAEFLPFVLLNKPLHTDQWGNPIPSSEKNVREYVYGMGFSPIGFRLQWRSNTRIRPFLEAKGGMLGFTKKAPATQATYENFSLQSMGGVQVKVDDRWGVRLGLFGDFHFSNAFIVPANPGLDVMNANLALSYHF